MSKIKVNCPKCKHEVRIEKAFLSRTNGRVVCAECTHVFQLVKKTKKDSPAQKPNIKTNTPNAKPQNTPVGAPKKVAQPVQSKPTQTKPTKTPAPLTKEQNKTKQDIESDIQAMFNDTAKTIKSPTNTAAPPSPKTPKPQQKRAPIYRIPKANNKSHHFAEVPQSPFAFNLIEKNTAQLPQVANASDTNPARTNDTQNNITIHTDSLVFTLVSENGQNHMARLPQTQLVNAPIAAPNGIPPSAPTPIPVTHSEINWTIATIGALIVLILQLFNLIIILI